MTRSRIVWLLAGGLLLATTLAGCGVPDEQEADESPRSEQESVGEGEVPGVGTIAVVGAIVGAALLLAWRGRSR